MEDAIHKIVPLEPEDKEILIFRRKKFFRESIKRYIGILIFAGFLLTVKFLVKGLNDLDTTPFYWIFLVIAVIFTIVNFVIYKKFYDPGIKQNKLITEGKITEKGYSRAVENTLGYELDKENKTITLTFKEHKGAVKGVSIIYLKYDKRNFDNSIPVGQYLYFIVNGEKHRVDVSHFALFDEGENIQIEQFEKSKDLIRIKSLDDPSKIIQSDTLKFLIAKQGIESLG